MQSRISVTPLVAAFIAVSAPAALHAQKPKFISVDSAKKMALTSCPTATCSITGSGKLTKLASGTQVYVFTSKTTNPPQSSGAMKSPAAPVATKSIMIDALTGKIVTKP